MKTHRDLIVYQKSILFVSEIYLLTSGYPKSEQFGIVSQMRRSAVSIPSNIAEGSARNSDKEFKYFSSIALGSATELNYFLQLSKDLGYIDDKIYFELSNKLKIVLKMLNKLIQKLR